MSKTGAVFFRVLIRVLKQLEELGVQLVASIDQRTTE